VFGLPLSGLRATRRSARTVMPTIIPAIAPMMNSPARHRVGQRCVGRPYEIFLDTAKKVDKRLRCIVVRIAYRSAKRVG